MEEAGHYISDYALDTKEVKKDFVCSICHGILMNVIELTTCGHVFCRICIQEWYKTSQACPLCKTLYTIYDMNESKFTDRQLDELNVSCPICDWKGTFGEYKRHLYGSEHEICKQMIISCGKCGNMVKNERMSTHYKVDCEFRKISCEQCNHNILYREYDSHKVNNCGETEITCENDDCDYTCKRMNMDVHTQECPHEMILCELNNLGCTEFVKRKDMKKHVDEYDKHITCALDSIDKLKSEMDLLNDHIETLKLNNKTLNVLSIYRRSTRL